MCSHDSGEIMAISLSSVLDELGIGIKPSGIVCRTPGINCLGVIESISDLDFKSPVPVGSFVWHAEPGWAPIDRMELERWLVDSPKGVHWIISERNLLDIEGVAILEHIDLTIWGIDDLAQWLGHALLSGRISLSIESNKSESINSISQRIKNNSPKPLNVVAYKPKVNLTEWLSQRGYERLPVRPILLEGRQWVVEGKLIGPDDVSERHSWKLIDDPFTGELIRYGDVESLPSIPHLERVTPLTLKTTEMVRSELPSICEERRHWRMDSGNESGTQGSILHWWRISEKDASMSHSPVLIPAWDVNFPGSGWMLVHGLTGEVLNSPLSNRS